MSELSLEKREAFATHLRAKGTPPPEITRLCAELERGLRQAAVAAPKHAERERVFALWDDVYAARQRAQDDEHAAAWAGGERE